MQKLGRLAGISTRTLRYYDAIGLLKPARINSSGYRIYGQAEVDRLQQILFYRELKVDLDTIKEIVTSPSFDRTRALAAHRQQLIDRRGQLDLLILNVEKTIAMTEGRITMADEEKFEGFKQKLIDENEEKYGKEIREKFGEDIVNRSNEKLRGMTPEAYAEVTRLQNDVKSALAEAFKTGDPAAVMAQEAADLHRQWLGYFWPEYSKEAHAGLAQMYVDDDRFRMFYDETEPGLATFLRDAVHIYTGHKK